MARAPRITINLEKSERTKLDRLAAVNQRSIAGEARLAIIRHLEENEPKKGRRS